MSGCFLRSLVGNVDDGGGVSLGGNVEASACRRSGDPEIFRCTYIIFDDEGLLFEITSTLELLGEFGIFGVIIDPLILQVPADATNVTGTYNNAGSDEPLVITEATTFPVTPDISIDAEAGTKFLILELPDAVAEAVPETGQDFDFTLDFDVPDPTQAIVKPMLTARVDVEGTRYYPPVFPCVTDFAEIAPVQIPIASQLQDLRPALAGIIDNAEDLACDEVVYQFGAAPTTTTTTTSTSTTTTVVPTTTAAPTTVPPTTVAPTTAAAPQPGTLPPTGYGLGVLLAAAAALLATGVVVARSTRRRPPGGSPAM